ncbi:MAG: hypothetical protein WKG07_24585 [Hymenobacter sp.]
MAWLPPGSREPCGPAPSAFGVGTNALNLGVGVGAPTPTPAPSALRRPQRVRRTRPAGSWAPAHWASAPLSATRAPPRTLGFGFKFKSKDLLAGVRGAFHYPLSDKFDPYAGITLGFRKISLRL